MSNESLHILVDKEARRSKSLMILQRYYSNAVEIKDDTVHTAVYNFNLMTSGLGETRDRRWLFITRNKTTPLYSCGFEQDKSGELRIKSRYGDQCEPSGPFHHVAGMKRKPGHSRAVDPRR